MRTEDEDGRYVFIRWLYNKAMSERGRNMLKVVCLCLYFSKFVVKDACCSS